MGRQAQHTHALPDGTEVGYSLTERPGGYRVRFVGPDGTRVERSTGCRTKAQARQAATDIITEAYRPAMPAEPSQATWETVLAELDQTPDLRPESIRAYRTAVMAFRKVVPTVASPAGVTTALAHRFKREFLASSYARGKASDAKTYKRSPTSCTTYLRCLRSLWSKHFRPLGHVKDNPWLDVPYPNAPRGKRVRVPEEDVVTAFFKWLAAKHPDWELPRLFVQVKMLAGCRTIDLCKLRSDDLHGDELTMSPEVTKTRTARTVPLPADVAADLRRVAGSTWLWENSLEESKRFRPNPKTKTKTAYSPSTWRWTVQNLFREFNAGRTGQPRLRPHDLRARAFTVVAAATQSVDATARAMGADPQTARHYLDAAKAFDGSGILKQAANLLRPRE
ncbi:MAG TPA: site-specific integrase [Urbifossiella sp.]|nr:site-specific integrase [Urbifossiella sp.]